ncbi:MAG: sigma-70 family RNA polymerase sigma factor [Actinomycetota bacterium]
MTPKPAADQPPQSARASELALLWQRYVTRRDDRSHRELLLAVDRLIRSESRRMLVSHPYLAEEAAQEALLGVERKIVSLEVPDHPVAFVRKVLSNKVATLLQREARRRAREERVWSPEAELVEEPGAGSEYHAFLGTLRTAVSDDEFWTLVLRHQFDFSYDEIGELLDKEPGAIRQIALRGRRKGREKLTHMEGRFPAWLTLGDDAEIDARPRIDAPRADGWVAPDRSAPHSDPAAGLRRAAPGSADDHHRPAGPVRTVLRRFGNRGRRWLVAAPAATVPHPHQGAGQCTETSRYYL